MSRAEETSDANFETVGTMAERIHAANFLLAAAENQGFYVGSQFLALDGKMQGKAVGKNQPKDFIRQLSDVRDGLRKVGFVGDLDMDSISPEAWRTIRKFALEILNDTPVSLKFDPTFEKIAGMQSRASILNLASLKLALMCKPIGEGKFKCKNLFCTVAEFEFDGIRSPVLPYFLIDPERMISVDNLDYQEMIASFNEAAYNQFSSNKSIPLLLALLKSYDNTGKQVQLQAADKLSASVSSVLDIVRSPLCNLVFDFRKTGITCLRWGR